MLKIEMKGIQPKLWLESGELPRLHCGQGGMLGPRATSLSYGQLAMLGSRS
ncbi:hypothetical protein [Shewanella fodinae]|uniref:Uncharacterized protein n=1 Tax=Shewanella fodinae TaxID=552357 RepID=A0A4V2RS72_9GAMM|nr:hypothetical protein [Shewanella fodinae]TCN83067.1 hypothetical protein EDC91_11646 [Shewanella fodinae]